MVSSFGRRAPEPEPDFETEIEEQPEELVILPSVLMRPIEVPVVLAVDITSLNAISQQITDMVAAAVRAGFDQAASK